MDGISIMLTVIGSISTVCAIIFGYAAFSRTKRKDSENDGAKIAIMLTEIGYVKSGVDDIKKEQIGLNEKYIDLIGRVIKVEASAHSAHKRIDALEDAGGA